MRACIFDLDGTLLDSTGVWEAIDAAFLAKRGIGVPPGYIEAVSALSFPEAAAYTIRRFGLPDSAEGLLEEWNGMAAYAYGHTVELKPGAREYLSALRERGVRLAVATSLPPALYEPALENLAMRALFDAVCSTDEVGCGKSRPDIFLLAAERLGVPPAQCAVFEDIPEAARSAREAGMRVYGVYDGASRPHWEEMKATAHGVLRDFRDAPLPE